ncbi:MAG TPA: hypothetical protein VK922_16025 [Gemmatimonadaceae bacterium]|nr:hypothetical protein [Gemmatimonadaceae bacterium]
MSEWKAPMRAAHDTSHEHVSQDVLVPVSAGRRNRWWEAAGLLDLVARLEAGELPRGR